MLNFILGLAVGLILGVFCICLMQGESEVADEPIPIYSGVKK